MSSAYREYRAPSGLEPLVACLWENDRTVHDPQPVVPDGCIDLNWLGEQGFVVVGADTGPWSVEPIGVRTCGIRLRAGAAGAVLGMPASEVRDQRVPMHHLWGDAAARIGAALAEADERRRLGILAEAVLQRHATPDHLVMAARTRLGLPDARIATVAADLGVSERHLHRRVLSAVGYGPKTLARVARLRSLIALGDQESLAVRAIDAGYASQAHMNSEVRRLTGKTPVRFLKDASLTAA